MNRPTGVTILAWLAIIGGALAIIGAIAAVLALIAAMALGGAAALGGAYGAGAGLAAASMIAVFLGLWLGILGIFEIIFGVGALQLKPWAWTLGVIWCYVSGVSNIISLFASRSGIFGALIGLAIAVAILYYLYTEEVKVAFGKQASATPAFLTAIGNTMNKQGAAPAGGYQPPAQGSYQPPVQGSYQPPAQGGYAPPPAQSPPPAAYTPPAPPAAPAAPPAAPEATPPAPGAPDSGSTPPEPPA